MERLETAWMKQSSSSSMPLPDLPHLTNIDVTATPQQVSQTVSQ